MPVQEEVIPLLLSDRLDIIALAQTGTGKTAAYGIPLLELTDPEDPATQAVVLCPTRELCLQITSDISNYAKYMPEVKILAVYGGSSIENQIRQLKRGVQIIVATPGRLIDLIERRAAKLGKVTTLVLDEADEMLNMGFLDSINTILETIPPGRQTMLFSATMPPEIASIAAKYMNDPAEVTIGTANSGAENVEHFYYLIHAKDKYLALKRIADFEPEIYGIVFCRTRKETQEIASKLIEDGYNADALHGDLSQAQRDNVMQRFRIRNLQILVATDVAARGLDVDDLTHVIHFSLPESPSIYNHRSGRTGRAGKSGISISLANLKEKHVLHQIEKKLKKPIHPGKVPTGQEICSRQLIHWIDKLKKVEESSSQIDALLPDIMDRLGDVDRESLIRKLVTLEFTHFLDYYHDTRDVQTLSMERPERKDRGDRTTRNERGEHRERRERGAYSERNESREKGYRPDRNLQDDGHYTRLFINLGKLDKFYPEQLIDLVNRNTKGKKIPLGKIDLSKKFSFFEVETSQADKLIKWLNGATFNGRKVMVEKAKD
ncbi:MAG: DEAD/DEAH box helicase [Bacteroidales bacterium]